MLGNGIIGTKTSRITDMIPPTSIGESAKQNKLLHGIEQTLNDTEVMHEDDT